jgi:hypothetical protein
MTYKYPKGAKSQAVTKALKYIAKALATLQRLNVKIFLAHNAGL